MLSQRIWDKSGWEVRELEISKVYECVRNFNRNISILVMLSHFGEWIGRRKQLVHGTSLKPLAGLQSPSLGNHLKNGQSNVMKVHWQFRGPPTKNHRLVISTPQPPCAASKIAILCLVVGFEAFSIHDWTDLDLSFVGKRMKKVTFFRKRSNYLCISVAQWCLCPTLSTNI